jgi:hypothetical protein
VQNEYPVIVKTYDLTVWYVKKLSTLPKNHRYTIAERIQNSLYDLLALLSDAVYSKEKRPLLHQANKEIEKLRLFTRLLKDLTIISRDNYYFIINTLDEIGKMVGGWMRGHHV